MVMGMSESIYRKLEALVLILLLLLMLFWAKAQAGALQTEISAAPVYVRCGKPGGFPFLCLKAKLLFEWI